MSLMVSISGIRGIVGKTLTPETVVKYVAAFGEYCKRNTHGKPVVVLGRDGREGGNIIANIASSTLLSTGVDVRALGICPTPTIQLAVEKTSASGGISVTASHNPASWNGLKFLGPSGMFLDLEENRALWSIADSGRISYAETGGLGSHTPDDSWIQKHIEIVLSLPILDADIIRKRKLKVVADCVNASGGKIVPLLLNKLGCKVVEMNCDLSGRFAHTPEPIPENLGDLCERVKIENADLGIAVDPDGDRLVLITEKGEPYGEEYTIASAVEFVLRRKGLPTKPGKPQVVINLSTTRAVEEIALIHDAQVVRTPVGEINVAKKAKEIGAIIAGEGSGGVIVPSVHFGRDAMAAIPLILQLLCEQGGTISELKASLPQYFISKGKVSVAGISPQLILDRVAREQSPEAGVNNEDGLRLDFPDFWVHLRMSNTEPILRIIAEARTMEEATKVVKRYTSVVETMAAGGRSQVGV